MGGGFGGCKGGAAPPGGIWGRGGQVQGCPPRATQPHFFSFSPPPQPHPNVKPMMYANTLLQLGMM